MALGRVPKHRPEQFPFPTFKSYKPKSAEGAEAPKAAETPEAAEATETEEDAGSAARAYASLALQFEAFQNGLDDAHEVAISLAGYGEHKMCVTGFGYQGQDTLFFEGIVNGTKARLIQHVSQLNCILTAVKKRTDGPARRISTGFQAE